MKAIASIGTSISTSIGTLGVLAVPGLFFLACGGGTPPAQTQPRPTVTATAPPPPQQAPDAGGGDQGDAAPPPPTDTGPHKVASVQTATSAIAVDDSAVYYIDEGDGSLNSVAPTGGTRTTMYSSPGTVVSTPYLTQDSGTIYFLLRVQDDSGATAGVAWRQDKGADQPTKLGSGYKDDFAGITNDATDVYWASGNTIYKVPAKGGPLPQAASGSGNGPTSVAVDADDIFWTTDGTIFKSSKAHSAPQLVASGQPHATNMQLDGTTAYWVASATKLMKAPKAGGGPATMMVQSDSPISDFSIDGANIYYANANAIMKVASAGGAAAKVTDAAAPLGIAVDTNNIYWAAKGTDAKQFKDGAIMSKAK